MTNQETPFFYIQNIPITGRFVLAPMDGYTDSPMRRIARSHGSSISYSEFLNGIDVNQGHPHLKTQTFFEECERPFVFQIYDDQPERFLKAAIKLSQLRPDAIDINIGCSAKNVSNRGAGAGLLRNPKKIALIAESLVKNLPFPITAKIRLGWDESSQNYLEVAHILEECGVSLIAVHARTRRQEFSGAANWQTIGEIKQSVNIPVLGNGDVQSAEDGFRMMRETGCDGVMIGRAAIGNPWIFSNSDRNETNLEERLDVINQHLQLMVALYGTNIAVPMFRKHLVRYMQGYLQTSDIRRRIFTITDPGILIREIGSLLC